MNHLMIRVIWIWIVMSGIAQAGQGEWISLAAGLTVEPYVIEKDDGGFEVDIVRAALKQTGYQARFLYEPLLRTKASFEEGRVDGVMTVKANYPEIRKAFLSDEYITYHNVAVSLRSRNLAVTAVTDLAGTSVDAYQQARFALGTDFMAMADNNPLYHEMANQRNQVAKLYAGRTDVIILDKRIFRYYRNELASSSDRMTRALPLNEPVTMHDLFEPSRYMVGFRLERHRNAFNEGLSAIRESGLYDRIIAGYLGTEK
ncbi:hypothetical protein JCM14469_01970 [Desulfatiferula olefinivorans]